MTNDLDISNGFDFVFEYRCPAWSEILERMDARDLDKMSEIIVKFD